jgi:hypothetical protein
VPDPLTLWSLAVFAILTVPGGRELVKWPRSVCCLHVLPPPVP